MSTQSFVILLVAIVLVVYAGIAIRTWWRFRGTRVVTCPETRRAAGVTVDVGHAMASAVWERADVRIAGCSCWPERCGCEESCVPQIEASPEGTRVTTMAERFFQGRRCVLCQRRIGPTRAGALQPGFMDPLTRQVVEWTQVPAPDLPDAIARRRPLCPDCTLAESSRSPYPITYRRTRSGPAPRP
jgi:hypothetical protein